MGLNIVFPENIQIKNGELKYATGDFIDPLNYGTNILSINDIEYSFTYLGDLSRNKGGNSIILKLYETQYLTVDDTPNYETPDLLMKINKRPTRKILDKSSRRFQNEVSALLKCRENSFDNIVRIYDNGIAKVDKYEYLYYTMEYGNLDLKTYIEYNHGDLSFDTKVSLCLSLAKGVKELNSLGVYHRDLKPDNIFITMDGGWKIGDLGLVGSQGEREYIRDLDSVNEFVGPRGWISPEAMNKYLTEDKGFAHHFDCVIDHQSDIYQLGKIFWYIFQHNSPIGYLKPRDFLVKDIRVFYLIKSMLYYSKDHRVKQISEIINVLEKIEKSLLKVA